MPRILIIAHRELLRQALDATLQRRMYDVVSTCDPLLGIELALTLEPDVVVIDHDTLVMDSVQVVRELREVCRDATPRVVLVSSHGERERAERLPVRHRTASVLPRPYRTGHLLHAVDAAVADSRPGALRRATARAVTDAFTLAPVWETAVLSRAASTRS